MIDRGMSWAPLAEIAPIEPDPAQSRLAALALLIVAAFTIVIVAIQWVTSFDGPLLPLLAAAYCLFNLGYLYCVLKGRLQSTGVLIGAGAAVLYLLAMFLSDFESVWTALSLCAVAASLVGAYFHFNDARVAAT